MVEGSKAAAKYVIPFHYADAIRSLEAFKMIKNTTTQTEVAQLRTAWGKLQATAEAQEKDDLLSKFDGRIAKGLMDRVAHASGTAT